MAEIIPTKKPTELQQRWIDYYIETGNATEAAKLAGYRAKTDAAFRAIGAQNLTKLNYFVQQRLAEKSAERIAKQDEILETLTRILRREATETVVLTTKTAQTYTNEQGRRVTETKEEPQLVEIPTKISDVNRAAELLGKRYGLYKDGAGMAAPVTVMINYDYGDTDDTDDTE